MRREKCDPSYCRGTGLSEGKVKTVFNEKQRVEAKKKKKVLNFL